MLLQYSTKDQIKALEEIALNIVKNTPVSLADQVEICKRHRRPLKFLALKRYPIKPNERFYKMVDLLVPYCQ